MLISDVTLTVIQYFIDYASFKRIFFEMLTILPVFLQYILVAYYFIYSSLENQQLFGVCLFLDQLPQMQPSVSLIGIIGNILLKLWLLWVL